jgi:hypothetical protein
MSMKHVMSDTPANLVQTYSRTRVNHPVQPLSMWTGLGWKGLQVINLGRGHRQNKHVSGADVIVAAVHSGSATATHGREDLEEGDLVSNLCIGR